MRSSFAIAAFAVGAFAVPYAKRGTVVEYDIAYVTEIVTVTAGQEQPTAYATSSTTKKHYGHHVHSKPTTTSVSEAAPTSTSEYVAPAPETTYTPSTTEEAVATYYAPATTEEPTSTSAPATTQEETSTSSAPAATSSSASSGTAPSDYQGLVTYHHNLHRANHSVPDLEWSDDLYSSAQEIAASCVYAHNTDVQGGGYGQNIAAGVEPANISAIITDLFYNGEEPYFSGLYGQDDPDMSEFEKWGHFSQIVWKSTTQVACATQHCPNGLANVGSDVSPYFTVCNYKGPGNYAGEYGSNVLKPLGQATAQWNTGSY